MDANRRKFEVTEPEQLPGARIIAQSTAAQSIEAVVFIRVHSGSFVVKPNNYSAMSALGR
jgi:copper homeostasis protein CutC